MQDAPISIEFNGYRFVRSPNAKSRSARVYYTAYNQDRGGKRAKGVGQLHTEVWKSANPGRAIPPGWVIHHIDEDPYNNDPDNLVCVDRATHAALHRKHYERPELKIILDRIRPLASAWHRSAEGREWHREHGKRAWVDRTKTPAQCHQCGRSYGTYYPERSTYCSNSCNQAARFARRVDFHEVSCSVCGSGFQQHKTRLRPRTCSLTCGQRLRRETERLRLDCRGSA